MKKHSRAPIITADYATYDAERVKNARIMAVTGFEWTSAIHSATKPLHSLTGIIDQQALLRLAEERQIGGTVTVTFVSSEYLRIGLNWAIALHKLHLKNFFVIAVDGVTCLNLAAHGIPFCEANMSYLEEDVSYRSSTGFTAKGLAVTALKFPIVRLLIDNGFNVIMSDADAIWLNDPASHWNEDVDVAFQRVTYFPSSISQLWGFTACSGFVFFRANNAVEAFLNECIQCNLSVSSDQLSLNVALLDAGTQWQTPSGDYSDRVLRWSTFAALSPIPIRGAASKYKIQLLALPHTTFWRHEWVLEQRNETVICHPNTPKDQSEKERAFVALGIWFLDGDR